MYFPIWRKMSVFGWGLLVARFPKQFLKKKFKTDLAGSCTRYWPVFFFPEFFWHFCNKRKGGIFYPKSRFN